MLLLIDIGNTNTTIGFHYEGEIKHVLRLKTIIDGRGADEYSYIISGFMNKQNMENAAGAVLCSVVPEVTPLLTDAVKINFDIDPVTVHHSIKTGLKFLIKNAGSLGADRIANAVAAHTLYKGDVIVVDFGTATTFCVITEKGEYTGGAIMPGIALSVRALAEHTAALPLIGLKAPESILGKTTEENMRSGVIRGHAGAVEAIIGEIKIETGKACRVLATGGLADVVKSYVKTIDYFNPLLTLEGLKCIYELNR